MGFLSRIFGSGIGRTRTTTARRPLRIQNPSLGFLNLKGEAGGSFLGSDRAALASLFQDVRTSSGPAPRCDVLFVYCDLDSQGRVSGSRLGLREIIKSAGAYVAVVASENAADRYFAGIGAPSDWAANIVLVVQRKGNVGPFFSRLFRSMFAGTSMPFAWVQLVPQVPGLEHKDAPASIMLPEAEHIVFEKSA